MPADYLTPDEIADILAPVPRVKGATVSFVGLGPSFVIRPKRLTMSNLRDVVALQHIVNEAKPGEALWAFGPLLHQMLYGDRT